MAKRTVAQLIANIAQWWVSLNGPLIPPGKNYAQSQEYSGFQATFDAYCAQDNVTSEELTDLIAEFSFPQLSGSPD